MKRLVAASSLAEPQRGIKTVALGGAQAEPWVRGLVPSPLPLPRGEGWGEGASVEKTRPKFLFHHQGKLGSLNFLVVLIGLNARLSRLNLSCRACLAEGRAIPAHKGDVNDLQSRHVQNWPRCQDRTIHSGPGCDPPSFNDGDRDGQEAEI